MGDGLKLYKYVGLRGRFEHVLDILANERLYCADYRELKDPVEGVYRYNEFVHKVAGLGTFVFPAEVSSLNSLLGKGERPPRVCSLSASSAHFLLWAHYADGHRGVAIELELDVPDFGSPARVEYVPTLKEFSRTLLMGATPRQVLLHKTAQWAYEAEYRILHDSDFFDVSGRISGVLVGSKVSVAHLDLLAKIAPRRIPLVPTSIDWNEIAVVRSAAIAR